MADLAGADGAILIADPVTFPTDAGPALPERVDADAAADRRARVREVAARTRPCCSSTSDVVTDGAVGVRLDGVEMLPIVSQGAAPIGPELTITAGEGRVIGELAGKPALEKLRETIEELPPEELRLVQGGLLVGIVVDANKPDYLQGDFLVRGLVGADPDTGQVAIAADVHPGQVVRLHARDADSADADLREALSICMTALGGRPPAGALLFACNGRGRGMFGRDGHDVESVERGAGRRPGRGVLRRGRDRPGRRRLLPAYLYGHGGGVRMKLDGARVLLTGATGGLGQAIARALHERGASLLLTGRRLDVLTPLAEEVGGRAIESDLADPDGRGRAARARPGAWTCWSRTPGCRAAAGCTRSRSRRSTAR